MSHWGDYDLPRMGGNQMARPVYAACAILVVTSLSALGGSPRQGDSAPNSYVKLQTATPGTSQTGHANISGTSIAGFFQGDGNALTNLNAANILSGTLADARLSSNI